MILIRLYECIYTPARGLTDNKTFSQTTDPAFVSSPQNSESKRKFSIFALLLFVTHWPRRP